MLVGGKGLIQLFKPKISPNQIVFPFTKEKKGKISFTSLKKNVVIFFQSCVINH